MRRKGYVCIVLCVCVCVTRTFPFHSDAFIWWCSSSSSLSSRSRSRSQSRSRSSTSRRKCWKRLVWLSWRPFMWTAHLVTMPHQILKYDEVEHKHTSHVVLPPSNTAALMFCSKLRQKNACLSSKWTLHIYISSWFTSIVYFIRTLYKTWIYFYITIERHFYYQSNRNKHIHTQIHTHTHTLIHNGYN